MGLLLQHRVSHHTGVGAAGLHQHLEHAVHVKETFFIGHLGRGDVFCDVAALAVLPEDVGLGVAAGSVASHRCQISWLQVLVRLQVHMGLGVGSWKEEDSQNEQRIWMTSNPMRLGKIQERLFQLVGPTR